MDVAAEEKIRKEADELLYGRGLLALLEGYGTPHVTGSYALGLMAWRDLDVYIEADEILVTDFFELGGKIAAMLQPVKMHFQNGIIDPAEWKPTGLYWGVYLGDEREGAWKIDIWAVDSKECRRLMRYCDRIGERLDPASREVILEIKSRCWKDPRYRRAYSSEDIYRAVLDEGVSDIAGFRTYLRGKGINFD